MAQSHIIAVVGGKGGVGKSTFAANYAIATAIDTKQRVLLVDLDPKACGDLGMILGCRPKRTLLELGKLEGRIQAKQVMSFVSAHASGIHYLPSVLEAEQMSNLDAQTTGKALQTLKAFYNTIIIDLGSDIDENTVRALELSSLIYVVTMPEILVLRHTRKVIEKIQNLMFPMEMLKVVLNRYSPRKGISAQLVQNNLKKQVVAVIPEDEVTAVNSLTKAQPFVLSASRTEVTKSYFMLVRTVVEHQMLEQLSKLKKPDALSKLAAKRKGMSAATASSAPVNFDRS